MERGSRCGWVVTGGRWRAVKADVFLNAFLGCKEVSNSNLTWLGIVYCSEGRKCIEHFLSMCFEILIINDVRRPVVVYFVRCDVRNGLVCAFVWVYSGEYGTSYASVQCTSDQCVPFRQVVGGWETFDGVVTFGDVCECVK